MPKSITDLDYGLPKNCVDYQSNNTTPARSMAIVSDGEVVVFDDIDDSWQGLKLDLGSTNMTQVNRKCLTTEQDEIHEECEESGEHGITVKQTSSIVGSTPSPTTIYPTNTSDFFKVLVYHH